MPSIDTSGWYYDTQLNNSLTSVSLHSNKWYDESYDNGTYNDGTAKRKGRFVDWAKCNQDNGFGPLKGATDSDQYVTNAGGTNTHRGCGYGLDPICRSILAEDFNVTISNTWSDFGGDPVSDVWNGARTKYGPYLKNIGESLNMLYEKNQQARQGDLGKVAEFITRIVDKAGAFIKGTTDKLDINAVRFLNKALISQGTRFSYYGGTGISFGNLGMKFTIFPKWDNYGNFVSVVEQVNKLYPYFIGRIDRFEEIDSVIQRLNADDNAIYDFLKKCFMWQSPPNDYKSELFDMDDIQEGTLKLKLGCHYELANLLCSDMMLNFSKNMVKNPEDNSVSPLFCDVAINLRPASKFTDISLRKFISGFDNETGYINNGLDAVNKDMKKKLDEEKQAFENLYKTPISNYLG